MQRWPRHLGDVQGATACLQRVGEARHAQAHHHYFQILIHPTQCAHPRAACLVVPGLALPERLEELMQEQPQQQQ